ncbi:MAG: AbrB/MazE/SpoVT family DNA-binding domain-containing protein [Pseudomonadota bacterium]
MNIHTKISKTVKVSKWGNSLAVRLPVELVRALGLEEGDEVALSSGRARDELTVEKVLSVEERLQRLKGAMGRMPKGYKFDREEANARREDFS